MSAPGTDMEALRRGWCPGALRPMESGDGLLVRIKPSCGVLALDQAEAFANAARAFGNGLIELTSRGNLQLRGVRSDTLIPLSASLDALHLLDASPAAEAVRNVISSPLAGIDATAFDTRPVAKVLEARLMSDASLAALPDKFCFLIDGGGILPLTDTDADIRFAWHDGQFTIGLAREAGCDWIGSCPPDDVPAAAVALTRSFLTHADGARRMRSVSDQRLHQILTTAGAAIRGQTLGSDPMLNVALIDSNGTTNVGALSGLPPATSSRRKPGRTQVSVDATPAESRGGAGAGSVGLVRSDVDEGGRVLALGVGLPYGGSTASALIELLILARDAGATELRLTSWRCILIPISDPKTVAVLAARATVLGFITDPADPRRAIAACPGAPACSRASTPIRSDADRFAAAAASFLGAGVSLHVSGCSKGCARRLPATLTLVAEAGRYGLVVNGAASAPASGQMTADAVAETLARLARAVTKADAATSCETAVVGAALQEIQAA